MLNVIHGSFARSTVKVAVGPPPPGVSMSNALSGRDHLVLNSSYRETMSFNGDYARRMEGLRDPLSERVAFLYTVARGGS